MIRLIIVIALITIFTIPSQGQFWKRKVNQLDENGKKHGYWIEYMDSEHVDISGKGRFEHGRETGKWTHYFWEGEWRFYDEKRKLQKIMMYEEGKEGIVIWERNQLTIDS